MKIGVLQTGSVPSDLVERHGPYVTMFERMLTKADPAFSAMLWDVNEGEEIPSSPSDADGWIITGSKHGVYEDHSWIDPLKVFLREAHSVKAPIVGVCFGHQILAEALGGKVEKSDRGWGCGVHDYDVLEDRPWMDGMKQQIAIHAMHQDQVVVLPTGAAVLAESSFCPFAALAYGETAMSIQPHPEFSADFQREIISLRKGEVIPDEIASEALNGLGAPTDSDLFGRWITQFFRHAAAHRAAA